MEGLVHIDVVTWHILPVEGVVDESVYKLGLPHIAWTNYTDADWLLRILLFDRVWILRLLLRQLSCHFIKLLLIKFVRY